MFKSTLLDNTITVPSYTDGFMQIYAYSWTVWHLALTISSTIEALENHRSCAWDETQDKWEPEQAYFNI